MQESGLVVLDPGFEDTHSHHVTVSHLLGESIGNIRVYASEKLNEAITLPSGGRVNSYFQTPCYTNRLFALSSQEEERISDSFADELLRLYSEGRVQRSDTLLLHTGFSFHISGLAKFFMKVGRDAGPALLLCGMFDPGNYLIDSRTNADRVAWSIKYNLALTLLESSIATSRLVFATSCEEYVAAYQQILKAPVELHPAINLNSQVTPNKGNQSRRILIYVGSVKADKGIELILAQLENLLNSFPDIKFIVHWNTESPGIRDFPDAESHLSALEPRYDNFELYLGELSFERYQGLLNSVDAMLFNYHPESYFYKTSGVFWDGLARGCALLCTSKTWLSRQATSTGSRAFLFDYNDDASLNAALRAWRDTTGGELIADNEYKRQICRSFGGWVSEKLQKLTR
ncbi:glycosyltransferase [Alteromonas sp. ASW11-19]|uniref:Glycosyltransferase n=1 Tax=Alteromonas salexigens TaxID=2982530 RepID=A0ABT2VM93_9ALTE|nr:glycosyltransferase [Alteromonas salexigens]MCU7554437.1 glycosyltransferase [Alteromonas salexigens]